MTIFGVLITYACCWWMVLFMVLPFKVKMAENPPPGPAPSAPINPMLKRKLFVTTLLTILPTAVIYMLVGSAQAEEIYHAGGGCKPRAEYRSSGDVNAVDGYATGGKKVKLATIQPENKLQVPGDVYVGIEAPVEDYTNDTNPNLRRSDIYAGAVRVKPDGSVDYNGQPISPQPVYDEDCKE